MSALCGLGVDNVLVEIDGPEVPILDGSASPFVTAIEQAGVVSVRVPRRYLKVLKPVRVTRPGFRRASTQPTRLSPRRRDRFRQPDHRPSAQGVRPHRRDVSEGNLRARTFGFIGDVEKLWKAGFALGASLDNTVAVGETAVINPEGLRFADEFVRHKTLDAVGDLALSGYPLLASYHSYCGGHRLNFAVLEALFSDRPNYAIVESGRAARPAMRRLVPGSPCGLRSRHPLSRFASTLLRRSCKSTRRRAGSVRY